EHRALLACHRLRYKNDLGWRSLFARGFYLFQQCLKVGGAAGADANQGGAQPSWLPNHLRSSRRVSGNIRAQVPPPAPQFGARAGHGGAAIRQHLLRSRRPVCFAEGVHEGAHSGFHLAVAFACADEAYGVAFAIHRLDRDPVVTAVPSVRVGDASCDGVKVRAFFRLDVDREYVEIFFQRLLGLRAGGQAENKNRQHTQTPFPWREKRMDLWTFFVRDRAQVLQLTAEHLWMVAISMLIAVVIGVPAGVVLTRKRYLNKPVLGGASVIQTVPSLALFGFLLAVPWIGERAERIAILALVLYALLPMVRNTYVGITNVDPAVVETGRAMGMTDRQLLFRVELPLAMPTIVAGVRVATVISVGLATLAAAVGAGGLGEFIFRGLAMVNTTLILAGAIPAAVLALLADLLLGLIQRHLEPAVR